jgi:hypothetical protein
MTEVRGLGRAIFAAVFLMIGGILNVIYGIAAISNSNFYVHNTHYVFASLKGWGWVTLIIGIIEIIASLSLLRGGAFGRWFGIFAGSLAALGALLAIPAYPLLSIALFALSLWIVYGLVVYGESERELRG